MAESKKKNLGFAEPRGDVFETKKEVIITLELRGADEKTIDVEVHDTYVIIQAERHKMLSQKQSPSSGLEAPVFGYRLLLDLPARIVPSTMKKSFQNSVLEVRFKKMEPK